MPFSAFLSPPLQLQVLFSLNSLVVSPPVSLGEFLGTPRFFGFWAFRFGGFPLNSPTRRAPTLKIMPCHFVLFPCCLLLPHVFSNQFLHGVAPRPSDPAATPCYSSIHFPMVLFSDLFSSKAPWPLSRWSFGSSSPLCSTCPPSSNAQISSIFTLRRMPNRYIFPRYVHPASLSLFVIVVPSLCVVLGAHVAPYLCFLPYR